MAASVNNIAATFATVPVLSSSSSSASSPSSINPTTFALPVSPHSIYTSWNPHAGLPRSQKSSLLSLYGCPGPRPQQPHAISTVNRHQILHRPSSISVGMGDKLPKILLSYLDRNDNLKTLTLPDLGKGKKFILLGVSAAFAPKCSQFVLKAEETKAKCVDTIACVAMNDVFVMKAWGEYLGVADKMVMLSDAHGELARALGVCLDTSYKSHLGLGTRSRRFCLVAQNGLVKSVRLDEGDGFTSTIDSDVLKVL